MSLVLVMGTDGLKPASNWWRPTGLFVSMLTSHGLNLLDPDEPFSWSGGLGGTKVAPQCDPSDQWANHRELVVWSGSGRSLKWYLDAKWHLDATEANAPVDVIAHSHGGNVLVMALLYGAFPIRHVITVSTPVRADMVDHRKEARRHITGRWLHFYCNDDMTQAEGCIGDGVYPIRLTRTWSDADVNQECPGNGHSRCLNEMPDDFVRFGGVEFLKT